MRQVQLGPEGSAGETVSYDGTDRCQISFWLDKPAGYMALSTSDETAWLTREQFELLVSDMRKEFDKL